MQLTYKVSPQAIAKAISKVSGFSVYELKNEGHSHTLAQWRHLGMYLARESGMTYVEAGEVFNRHFSTALTSHRKVKKSLDDPQIADALGQIKNFLNKENKDDGNQEIL
jgi:chromosomal replication initiation ATPase DnaA|tara:strand:+ start:1361 stop:1687 length:327 start_codon:yes stop_codon:yes gene_type:complete